VKSRIRLAAFAAAPALVVGVVPAAYAAAQPQVTRAAVAGDVLPGLDSGAHRTGSVSADQQIHVAVSLAPRDKTGLDAFVAKVSDPHSASYGHYLTKQQFAARYGRTNAEVSRLTQYLRAQGLKVGTVHSGNLLVDASGTAAQLEKAFSTKLSTFKDAKSGRTFYANEAAPTLPTDIASLVTDVSGLNNRNRLRHQAPSSVKPQDGPGGGYTPEQLTGGYDVPGSADGSGQKVALLEFDGFEQSNIDQYDSQYKLDSPAPTVQQVDGGSGPLGGGQVEVELDIEMLNAIAPKADVTVFEGPNSDAGEVDTYQAIVDSGIPTASISWGLYEGGRTSSNIQAVDAVFEQGAAQGTGFYAASGDGGSDDAGNGTTSVDFPASDPFVTGVGGTTLSVGSDDSWSSESAWSGGGGGTSDVFTIPDWQKPDQQSDGGGQRQVPDVAALADPTPGLSIYSQGSWGTVGGTSAAAPEWAAFATLYNQQASAAGKPNLGFANPALYQASGDGFHDITSGSNGAYDAGTGWDFTTGLGSYDATALSSELLGD
jgi:kumamolisin